LSRDTTVSLDEAAAALFNNTFPNRLSITKSTIQRIVIRFEQTDSKTGLEQDQKLQAMMIRTSKFYNYL